MTALCDRMKLSPIAGAALAASLLTSADTALTQSQSADPSSAWIVIKYTTKIGDVIELVAIPGLAFCEVKGAAWAASKKLYSSSKKRIHICRRLLLSDDTEVPDISDILKKI